jgi:hypothetical protein
LYRRVGITNPAIIQNLPRIEYLLGHAEHGLPEVLDALRLSDEEEAQAFVSKYDSLAQHDRKQLKWEQIAVAAGITPRRFFQVAVGSLMMHEETMGQIISATAHPLVVRRAVQVALTPQGHRDRHDLMQARGFLPIPQGSTTILNRVNVANIAQAQAAADGEKAILPEMEDDLKDIHALFLEGDK